jgi:hypothetical protein
MQNSQEIKAFGATGCCYMRHASVGRKCARLSNRSRVEETSDVCVVCNEFRLQYYTVHVVNLDGRMDSIVITRQQLHARILQQT